VFVGQDPIENPPGWRAPPVANDCAMTAKGFAQALAYAHDRMGGRGIAIATDFGLHPMMLPRFGPGACGAYRMAPDPGVERARFAGQYRTDAQTAAVRYADFADGTRAGGNAPLRPYRLGSRTYSVNTDGLAHYGMLPDVLQDTRNVGLPEDRMAPLFRSAEDYIQMWEKARRVGGAPAGRFTPTPLDCRAVCRGTCPRDPRGGAPVAAR
jgi:hypothetical protein